MRPLPPLPPALAARLEVQREGETSWQSYMLWLAAPPELWPEAALAERMDGTGHDFADPLAPTGAELRGALPHAQFPPIHDHHDDHHKPRIN